jgi:hypothetical protein
MWIVVGVALSVVVVVVSAFLDKRKQDNIAQTRQ